MEIDFFDLREEGKKAQCWAKRTLKKNQSTFVISNSELKKLGNGRE